MKTPAAQIEALVTHVSELKSEPTDVSDLVTVIMHSTGFLTYGVATPHEAHLDYKRVICVLLAKRLVQLGWPPCRAVLIVSGLWAVLLTATEEKIRLGYLCLEGRQAAWYSWDQDVKIYQHSGCRAPSDYKRVFGLFNDDTVTTAIQLCDDIRWSKEFLKAISDQIF